MSESKPRVSDAVAVVPIDGEAVVYDHQAGGQIHYLNHSAALVLALCDGSATMHQIARAIADVYEMPVDEVEPQVRSAVASLRQVGVLDGTRPAPATADGDLDERRRVRVEVPRSD
jgi:PqqD family protein of HPr-rel-A system